MLRHQGRKRKFRHNLGLAVLLSLTAGIVNVAGFLAFSILTTNITGHVAGFAEKIVHGSFIEARVIFLWMFLFFCGAYLSSWSTQIAVMRDKRFMHALPIAIEILILLAVGYFGHYFDSSVLKTEILAGSLLFAMGLQNAIVTMISGSVVRTTHLTGIITDLGIELSQLVHAQDDARKLLNKQILLKAVIVLGFLTGGITGGYSFSFIGYKTFVIPAVILIMALYYDTVRLNYHRVRRRYF
ncbi:MAG: YoaK family protein [Bacteroidota bacterium]